MVRNRAKDGKKEIQIACYAEELPMQFAGKSHTVGICCTQTPALAHREWGQR